MSNIVLYINEGMMKSANTLIRLKKVTKSLTPKFALCKVHRQSLVGLQKLPVSVHYLSKQQT